MTRHRIKIEIIGNDATITRWTAPVRDTDELRGEIEKICMELEDRHNITVRCVEVEEVKEDKHEMRIS